jgi:prepilin-type N-terminal cleavage/methylation domain-containing protein
MKQIRSKGFTLIELLVVIAIIGILSAVVLASLNTARSKGSDAAIESNLNTIRTQAELEYSNYNQYASVALSGTCPTVVQASSMFDPTVVSALKQIASSNANAIKCEASIGANSAYAISAALVTNPAIFYCIDSTGIAATTSAAVSTTHC